MSAQGLAPFPHNTYTWWPILNDSKFQILLSKQFSQRSFSKNILPVRQCHDFNLSQTTSVPFNILYKGCGIQIIISVLLTIRLFNRYRCFIWIGRIWFRNNFSQLVHGVSVDLHNRIQERVHHFQIFPQKNRWWTIDVSFFQKSPNIPSHTSALCTALLWYVTSYEGQFVYHIYMHIFHKCLCDDSVWTN